MATKASIKKLIPSKLKRIISNLRLSISRLKYRKIQKVQKQILKTYSPTEKKIIVFFTPGKDIINGGLLSIASLYEETRKLREIHKAETFLCSLPGEPSLLKYTKFKNNNDILNFFQILKYFKIEDLQLHIPEYAITYFPRYFSRKDILILKKIPNIKINVLLQNIDLMPKIESFKELSKLGKLTCTTAHQNYSTIEQRNKLGCPLHKLSTYVSPEQYNAKKYSEKEELMIVSPDPYPRKEEILNLISTVLPQLKIQVIKGLTYEEYKETISRAKWALTFGEGLDGYFIETIFSGGISFSVYNKNFFTEDFKSLRTVYDNYDQLSNNISKDIFELDREKTYYNYQKKQFELCCKRYNYKEYQKNLEAFYKEQYTYK